MLATLGLVVIAAAAATSCEMRTRDVCDAGRHQGELSHTLEAWREKSVTPAQMTGVSR